MKTYKLLTILFCVTSLFSSCDDVVNKDNDWDDDMGGSGAPVINKITASADTSTAISVASLNQSIAVFGDNLAHVKEVMINDISVELSQIYAKRHRLELVIPRVIPENVNNKLVIRTKEGEVSADLEVILPELSFKGFSNDFAADGDTVRIKGSNFDLYLIDSVNAAVTLNGNQIKIFNCSADEFSIQVPVGTPTDEKSELSISSPKISPAVNIPFRDKGFPVLSDDPITHQNGPWFPSENGVQIINVTEDSDPPAPMFKMYMMHKRTYTSSWQYTNICITHFWLGHEADDVLANPQNYVLKFELLNPAGVPMSRLIKIGFPEDDYGFIYDWDPAATNGGTTLNTMGLWQTISLEVTDVFCKDGQCHLKISDNPGVDGIYNNFKMAGNRELAGDMEFYCWNFRICEKLSY